MSTETTISPEEPTIVMTRVYDAPRALVWKTMTQPEHIKQWWGGPGASSPVCEMDVRPNGVWNHVLRFPNGFEVRMSFVFLEVEAPSRLVWQHVDHGKKKEGPPTSITTLTLDDLGGKTRWTMVARFSSMADRETALEMGYTKPIAASAEHLTEYLQGIALV